MQNELHHGKGHKNYASKMLLESVRIFNLSPLWPLKICDSCILVTPSIYQMLSIPCRKKILLLDLLRSEFFELLYTDNFIIT